MSGDANFFEGRRPSTEYEYDADMSGHVHHAYLAPRLLDALGAAAGRRLLDLGCGDGSLTMALAAAGFETVGSEASGSGLNLARERYPVAQWLEHDIDSPLPDDRRGQFDVVVAAEVIEHLFLPRHLFERAREALVPGGVLVITTPYHGYVKNVALALSNKLDHHYRPGWDYGHIKFFSKATLGQMAQECGFSVRAWSHAGRHKVVAKSMILVANGPR